MLSRLGKGVTTEINRWEASWNPKYFHYCPGFTGYNHSVLVYDVFCSKRCCKLLWKLISRVFPCSEYIEEKAQIVKSKLFLSLWTGCMQSSGSVRVSCCWGKGTCGNVSKKTNWFPKPCASSEPCLSCYHGRRLSVCTPPTQVICF